MMSSLGTTNLESNDAVMRWASIQSPARKNVLSGELRAARYSISTQDLNPIERLAIESFRAVEKSLPELNWLVHTHLENPASLAKWADLVLVDFMPTPSDVPSSTHALLDVVGVKDPLTRRRTGIWMNTPKVLNETERKKLTQELQAAGMAVVGGNLHGY